MLSVSVNFLIISIIINPILSHVIVSDKKERYNAFENADNEKLLIEPIYEYPTATRIPIYPSSTTPSTSSSQLSSTTTKHSHILRIPKKGEPSPLSVVVPEAIVYITANNPKNLIESFGGPLYAEKEAKNIEILTDNTINNNNNQFELNNQEESKQEKVRYKDILVTLALWNLANTFNQYETETSSASFETSGGTANNNLLLDGFQIEPVSQEIKLRSNEILKIHNTTD